MTKTHSQLTELPEALFERQDNSDDLLFYAQPRLVTHIDDATINALTQFYSEFVPAGADVLDLMSSWISHLPDGLQLNSVVGHGMNAQELGANQRLTSWLVQDLNRQPSLDLPTSSIDRILLCVSIQYLTNPVAVLSEARRLLRTDGRLCIAMSHRMFPTKAIRAFHELAPAQRISLVQHYLQLAGYANITFVDASPGLGADPLWLVLGDQLTLAEDTGHHNE